MARLLSVEQHIHLQEARAAVSAFCSVLTALEGAQTDGPGFPNISALNPRDLCKFLQMITEKLDAIEGRISIAAAVEAGLNS